MLAFVMLWAYFAFSQFLIIWSANLPEEIPWYLKRFQGGWQCGGARARRGPLRAAVRPAAVARREAQRAAGWRRSRWCCSSSRFVDLFWMLVPAFHPEGVHCSWLDVATVVGVGGVWIAIFVRQPRRPSR